MAGQYCSGKDALEPREAVHNNAQAFCEGREARVAEVTPSNPFQAGSEAAAAWDRGVASKAAGDPDGCCAPTGAAAV